MTWTGTPDNAAVNLTDIKDGLDNDYLQGTLLSGGDEVQDEAEASAFFTNDGSLASTTIVPTKADLEAARLWDPSINSDQPSGFTASSAPIQGVTLGWTDDPDVPSVDSSWARDQIETVIFRNTSDDFGSATEIQTVNYGTTSFTDATVSGGTYYYWIRYRNKTDGSMTGPLVGPESAVAT